MSIFKKAPIPLHRKGEKKNQPSETKYWIASVLEDYPNIVKFHPAALYVLESIRYHITAPSSAALWEKRVRLEVLENLLLILWTKGQDWRC